MSPLEIPDYPLLMLHNKEDMRTTWAQGVELFTGMRRLGNRCWMLDGVPARLKGIQTGLALDSTGRVPRPIYYKNSSPHITKEGREVP